MSELTSFLLFFSVKAFKNLAGEDSELGTAYANFHKMVEQEQGVVWNATLASVEQLRSETSTAKADMGTVLATSKRTEGNTEALIASTKRIHDDMNSKVTFDICLHLTSNYVPGREAALERDELLRKLSSLHFDDNQRDIFDRHLDGTGQWLLKTEKFQNWFQGDQNSTLWCPGIRMFMFVQNFEIRTLISNICISWGWKIRDDVRNADCSEPSRSLD